MPKIAVPVLVLTSLALLMDSQHQKAAQEEQVLSTYPPQTSVTSLAQGYAPEFGLHPLNKAANQIGSLCWMGYSNSVTQTVKSGVPLIQRVDVSIGEKSIVSNFALSASKAKSNGLIGLPLFKGSRESVFFRVFTKEPDYTRYEVYISHFDTLQAKSTGVSSILVSDFHTSPNGQFLAYTSMPPYYSTPSSLMLFDGKQKVVAQDQPFQGFSWTSDNHLLYAAFSEKPDFSRNFGYPDIYENDLKENSKVVKKGGYRPTFDLKKQWLAYVGLDIRRPESEKTSKDFRFYPEVVNYMAIFAFDVQQKKEFFVKRIYESYPDVVWVNQNLYVIENYYVFSKKTAYCRVSKFDSSTQTTKEVCKLEQKGESSLDEDGKLVPFFKFIGVANGKSLLMQVPVKSTGPDNYHLLSVSLTDGKRTDIFSFSAPSDAKLGYVDWIDG